MKESFQLNDIKPSYSELEAKRLVKFSKNISCLKLPLTKQCRESKTCLSGDDSKLFYIFHTDRLNKYRYNLMIHYNDPRKEIIISFAGPSLKVHPEYLNFIYSKGLRKMREYEGSSIEVEYAIVFSKIKKILYSKMAKIKSSNRTGYTVLFNGHSIGGAIATLAALDLTKKKLVNSIKVYTYGATRIGDSNFTAVVNKFLSVFRVIKKTDYITRTPACYFLFGLNVWRCFNKTLITNFYSYIFYRPVIYLPALIVRVQHFVQYFKTHITQVQTQVMAKYKQKRDKMIQQGHKNVIIKKHQHPDSKHDKRIIRKHKHEKIQPHHLKPRPITEKRKGMDILRHNKFLPKKQILPTHQRLRRFKKPLQITHRSPLWNKINNRSPLSRNRNLFNRNRHFTNNNRKSTIRAQINTIRSQISMLRRQRGRGAESQIRALEAQLRRLESELSSSFIETDNTEENKLVVLRYTPIFRNLIYYNESVWNLQQLGQVVYYDDAFTSYNVCIVCNQVFVTVPQTFTYDAHRSYFGETFDC